MSHLDFPSWMAPKKPWDLKWGHKGDLWITCKIPPLPSYWRVNMIRKAAIHSGTWKKSWSTLVGISDHIASAIFKTKTLLSRPIGLKQLWHCRWVFSIISELVCLVCNFSGFWAVSTRSRKVLEMDRPFKLVRAHSPTWDPRLLHIFSGDIST